MKYLLLLALIAVLLPAPAQAADPCDPAAVIAQANALKSSGDAQKDLAALIELSKTIEALTVKCTAISTVERASTDAGTRKKPVPFGNVFTAQNGKASLDIRISQAIRGVDALNIVKKTNRGADEPTNGREYLLAYVDLDYLTGDETAPLYLNRLSFVSFSNARFIDPPLFAFPQPPDFELKGLPGAKASGWILVEVYPDDEQPMIYFGSTSTGKGTFFATS